jgi:hypothetical protein
MRTPRRSIAHLMGFIAALEFFLSCSLWAEVLVEASKLVLTGDPVEIARQLRDRADRTIRPAGRTP